MPSRICSRCGKSAYDFHSCPWCGSPYSPTAGEAPDAASSPEQKGASALQPQKAATTFLQGLYFSVPVALISWIGLASGLDNVFWPMTLIAVIISLPWSILAGFLVGLVSFPFASYFNVNGYIWAIGVFYAAVVFGAHFNGYLFVRKRSIRSRF